MAVAFHPGRNLFPRLTAIALVILVVTPLATLGETAAPESPRPIPDAAAQKAAEKEIREVFSIKPKGNGSPVRELVAKLLKTAESETDDSLQFGLYRLAAELAADAGDLPLALDAARRLERRFTIDGPAVEREMIGRAVQADVPSQAKRQIVEQGITRIDELIDSEQFDNASKLISLLQATARRSRNGELIKVLADLRTRSLQRDRERSKITDPMATLEQDPVDPDANTAVGRYYALAKGDWQRGLLYLALGSNDRLTQLATRELRNSVEADERIALADGWWELADTQSGEVRLHLLGRAGYWYEKVIPGSTGLSKTKMKKRMLIIADATQTTSSGLRVVCATIRAKSKPSGLAEHVLHFDAPRGNGRRGANIILLDAPEGWQKSGTVWSCQYRRHGTARGIQFIHPLPTGHVLVTVLSGRVHLSSEGRWPGRAFTAGSTSLPVQAAPNFKELVRLEAEPHQLTSVVTANGEFSFLVDDQLVAVGVIPRALPLVLWEGFAGGKLERGLGPGKAGVIIGPRDGGENRADEVSLGLAVRAKKTSRRRP